MAPAGSAPHRFLGRGGRECTSQCMYRHAREVSERLRSLCAGGAHIQIGTIRTIVPARTSHYHLPICASQLSCANRNPRTRVASHYALCSSSLYLQWQHLGTAYKSETNSVDGSSTRRFITSPLPLEAPRREQSRRGSSTVSLMRMGTWWTCSIPESTPQSHLRVLIGNQSSV